MNNWFDRAFSTLGEAIGEIRHEILGGWFGRTFEPHPMQQKGLDPEQSSPGERDIHGNERGIDR
jgi:hypothetical protein